jgi:hypothetical protein
VWLVSHVRVTWFPCKMDVDEDGDEPVATFDVVLTRSPDPGGALYVLQSPLRPVDRPYNLEACDGMDVKVRPVRTVAACRPVQMY